MPLEDEVHAREREAFISNFRKIAPLLADPNITDISLNEPEKAGEPGPVFVDVVGKGYVPAGVWLTAEEAMIVVRTFASHARVEWNADNPCLSCQAVGGEYRLEAELPPATRRAPVFTIRRYLKRSLRLQDYVDSDQMHVDSVKVLAEAVANDRTILLAGETGSGKTTLLNALLHASGAGGTRRVLTIEDTPELEQPNPLSVQIVVKRNSAFDYEHGVQSALRHNPHVIALGEIRTGAAAYEALDAWQTGHSGMATLHAKNADGVLLRYLSLLRKSEAGRLVTPEELAHVIDVVVHVTKKQGVRYYDLRRVKGWNGKAFDLVPLVSSGG